MPIKYISFDMDDTLFEEDYDKFIWYVEIPQLYARKHKISFEKAIELVMKDYFSSPILERGEWYSVKFWFEHFGFEEDYREIMQKYAHHVRMFDDVIPALTELKKSHKLMLVTNASREFIEVKLMANGLDKYFDKVFSATSDFARGKRATNVFKRILQLIHAEPGEVVHVGDSREFDYEKPRSIGIKAILIDRKGKEKGEDVIHSLPELIKIIRKMD